MYTKSNTSAHNITETVWVGSNAGKYLQQADREVSHDQECLRLQQKQLQPSAQLHFDNSR